MAPPKSNSGRGRKKFKSIESSEDEEYRKKRDRNNLAVKRSRVKSRMRTQETLERVQQLKKENDQLEEKIKLLSRELNFLKDLFFAHTGSSTTPLPIQGVDLDQLLAEDTDSPSQSSATQK